MRIEPRCIALAELMRQTVAMMKPIADEKHVGIEIGIDPKLPLVLADPDRVLQVLINLVDNAVKFSPPDGAVMLQANVVEADQNFVYVAVSDTGRGIGPEAKSLIFERLYQDSDSIDNNRSGLGLGLFICREIIKLHQGRIWVSSELGQGSTFTFTLPVYSLTALLTPIAIHNHLLRPAFVLVRVELTPLTNPPKGNWKEAWQQALDILQRCVYLDKDLVLPPMVAYGAVETFLVVAATDLQQSEIMTTRIRKQLQRVPQLQSKCALAISTLPIELPDERGKTVEQQVQTLANCVNEMILKNMDRKQFQAASAPDSN
jgi:hypothetical protein